MKLQTALVFEFLVTLGTSEPHLVGLLRSGNRFRTHLRVFQRMSLHNTQTVERSTTNRTRVSSAGVVEMHVPLQSTCRSETFATQRADERFLFTVQLRMVPQIRCISKPIATHGARMRSRVAVYHHVPLHVVLVNEPPVAHCAFVLPLAAVTVQMLPQIAEVHERLFTVRTLVRLLAVPHHVERQVALQSEVLEALRTPVRFIRTVASSHVRMEVARTPTRVSTKFAPERSRLGVALYVFLEQSWSFKSLAAPRTFVWFLAYVNVHVYFKIIKPCKLLFALRALIYEVGRLAVSLDRLSIG